MLDHCHKYHSTGTMEPKKMEKNSDIFFGQPIQTELSTEKGEYK